MTIKTYPNQKPWIDRGIRAKLKVRTTAFNHGKLTGNMIKYKHSSYAFRKASKQAKHKNVSTKTKLSRNSTSNT